MTITNIEEELLDRKEKWTPEEALKSALLAHKAHDFDKVFVCLVKEKDGKYFCDYRSSDMSNFEQQGILNEYSVKLSVAGWNNDNT